MDKQKFLEKLSNALDELEDLNNLTLDYAILEFKDYNPENSKYERNYSWRDFELKWDEKEQLFDLIDNSEMFKGCDSYCQKRGYCNGDC